MATAALLCAAALGALARLAPALGLVDHPGARKHHQSTTPLVGGLAIYLAAAGALALGAAAHPGVAEAVAGLAQRPGLILGALALLVVGALDDRYSIKARYKLAYQLVCCIGAVVLDGVVLGEFGVVVGEQALAMGPLMAPFTVLIMLTILNGMNMIDGVDGVAGGIVFVALSIMTFAAIDAGYPVESTVLLAVLGGLTAFLAVNFPLRRGARAPVFLGDAGSLMLGFVVAYFAVHLSAMPHRVFRPSTALWFFFLPVADAMLLYVRRTLKAHAPFSPGRDHYHHILLRGRSPRGVCWLIVGGTAAMAGLAYAGEKAGVPRLVHLIAWLLLLAVFAATTQRSWTAAWLRSRRAERRLAAATAAASATDAPLPARQAA